MTARCPGCRRLVSSTGEASCSLCPSVYHKECVGFTDKFTVSKDWSCPECTKKKVRKGDNSSTPVRNVCSSSAQRVDRAPVSPQRTDTSREVPPVCAPHSEAPVSVDDAGMCGLRQELAVCVAEMREFRREMADLRMSLSGINARLDSFEQRLETVEKHQAPSSDIVAGLECTVLQLKQELNDKEQESLQADLEIGHLPEEKGENILHTLTVVGAKLGVVLEERDVVYAERVGTQQGAAAASEELRARRVVVRFTRRELRDRFLQAARVRRTLTAADAGRTATGHRDRIFVNERLTRVNRQLFHRVRDECRRLQWRFSWTKRGRIYARQADGKPAYPIRSEGDFARVFGKAPV